jgi:hypothetical protein
MCRVGQNRMYTPYMTVYLVISQPKLPYIHCICMVLVNPSYVVLCLSHTLRSTFAYLLERSVIGRGQDLGPWTRPDARGAVDVGCRERRKSCRAWNQYGARDR